jgi:hypothetical protein
MKQIFALILFILLVFVSAYIIPSIWKSIKSHEDLLKSRSFHNRILLRSGLFPLADHHHDIEVDLKITLPHATLTVDEPVDVKAVATIRQEFIPNVRTIVIGFNAAQATPAEGGAIRRPGIDLTVNNGWDGNTKICWPIEGTYKANISAEFMYPGTQLLFQSHTQSVDLITVCPKSEITKMVTNRAIIDLSIATYLIGVVTALNIIIQLWWSS